MDDRRIDADTRDRLDVIEDNINTKLRALNRILKCIIVLFMFTAVASAYLINDNRGRADRIQKSRAVNMYNNCRDQNQRNIATHKVLHRVIHESVVAGRITAKGGAASEAFTALLINALAPVRDCNQLVLDQIKQNPPKDKKAATNG